MTDRKTVIYAASAKDLSDPGLYEKALGVVSKERREKTERFRQAKDRYLSLTAELLLRQGLCDFGYDAGALRFGYGGVGKPFLEGCDLHFNLSHSEDYAVCAVSRYDVGCDVEKVVPIDLRIAKRFFFGGEYADISSMPTSELKADRFYRYWTLKESFMKVTGLGMKLPLNEFSIELGEKIGVKQTVDGRSYSFKEFGDVTGYKCAVCVAGDCRDASLVMLDVKNILLTE